jgi:cobalamin biosynthesis protein CobT
MGASSTVTTLAGPEDSMAGKEDLVGALQDTASVELSYQKAINGEPDNGHGDEGEKGEDEGQEDREDQQDDEDAEGTQHDASAADADDNDDMAWVDTFILNTRRNGGRLTETSILKTYKVSDCLFLICGPSPSSG